MRNICAVLFLFGLSLSVFSQNIAITDDDTYTANSSAMLDIKSLTKGMLVPRLTTVQRNAVSGPATGLLVFDTDKGSFYFFNGTSWINLTSGNANGIIGYTAPDKVYLTDVTDKFGIGTVSPSGKMEVKSDVSIGNELPIFNVVNSTGDTVFAVYEQGVRINVYDDPLAKANTSKGGFAVGGFSPAKGTYTNEYLRVTPDSIRLYIEEGAVNKATTSKGGFAVGGFSPAKSTPSDYFNIYGSLATTTLASEARIFWYPLKEAFLAGRVIVQSPDSVGTNSFSTGFESKAIGNYSQAFGYNARAFGNYSTAIGNNADARSDNSFAFGDMAQAKGVGSYAFGSVGRDPVNGSTTGIQTVSKGDYSVAFGLGALADTIGAFAIGNESHAQGAFSFSAGYQSTAIGKFSTSIGYKSKSEGLYSTALGNNAQALGESSIALGIDCRASTFASFAAGEAAYATGSRSTALGAHTRASSPYATAMGTLSEANGYASFAVGETAIANGDNSISMGQSTVAGGTYSFASGFQAIATGLASISHGSLTNSSGGYSVAIGNSTTASGDYSFAFGQGIKASGLNTVAWALNNQTGTDISNPNSFVIMGGDVGIDVDSPLYKLDVAGTVNMNSGISSGVALNVNSSEAIWYNGTYFSWGSGGQSNYFADKVGLGVSNPLRDMHIKQTTSGQGIRLEKVAASNYWDIGTGSNNNFQFYYNGALMSDIGSATGAYNQLSDQRKKKNIVPMESILNKVLELNPVRFNYKTEEDNAVKSYGFIAQDVEKIFPDMVRTFAPESDGEVYKGLSYDDFAVISIQAIIEMNKKLEDKISEQNAELNEMKANIKANQELIKENQKLKEKVIEIDEIKAENKELKASIEKINSLLEISGKK